MDCLYSPNVLHCMRFKHETSIASDVRVVMDYEFDFSVGCERDMWLEGKSYHINNGCFVIRKPGDRVSTKGVYDCYMLTLDFSRLSTDTNYSRNTATKRQKNFDSKMWDVLPAVFKPIHYDDYVRIFEKLLSINDVDLNENEKTLPLVNELLHILISDAYFHLHSQNEAEDSCMDSVCAYIKKNFAKEITLGELAKSVHLNKNYFARQFKQKFGISPINYLIRVRMDYAKRLLAETDLPVKHVSMYCGYRDPAFFNYYFKKTFFQTPLEYRRLCRM